MGNDLVTEAGIGIAEFLLASLTVAFGAWSLALKGVRTELKEFRGDWLKALDSLTTEVGKLRTELGMLGNRVTRVEVEQAHQSRAHG
jgi:hypothetical protein